MKTRTSRRSSRSTNTPARAENRTAGTRNVRIRALTAVIRSGRLRDDDGQAEDDHVPADLGRRLGEPEEEERPVPEDGEGAVRGCDGRGRAPARRHGTLGRGAAAALRTGSPRSTNARAGARRWVAPRARGGRTSGSGGRCRHPAGRRATCRRRTGGGRRSRTTSPRYRTMAGRSVIRPRVSKTRMAMIRDEVPRRGRQRHRLVGRLDRRSSRSGSSRRAGRRSRRPGSAMPTRVSGLPIARIVNGSRSRNPSTSSEPGGAADRRPGDDPDVLDRDRLGAGIAQLVEEARRRRSASMSPLTTIVTPGRTRRRARPRPGSGPARPGSARRDVSPFARSACRSSSWLWRVAISVRSWSLRVLRLPTSVVRSWADLFWSAEPPVCAWSWTTTSRPSRNGHRGDRDLAPAIAHRADPPSGSWLVAAADGRGARGGRRATGRRS